MISRPDDLLVQGRSAWFRGRRFSCEVGRGGVGPKAREGDGVTPAGMWRLTRVRWRADRVAAPASALPTIPIGPFDGWSDDPEDPRYDSAVPLPSPFGAERLRRRDRLYDVMAETDWHGPGSAIFVHVRRGRGWPTAGCVAFAEQDLRWILSRWRLWSRVVVRV